MRPLSAAGAAVRTDSLRAATSRIRTCPPTSSPVALSRWRYSGRGSRRESPSMRLCGARMSRADDAVASVSLWKGEKAHISPLSGGLTNENYLIEVSGARYVIRIPGQSTELLAIDRTNEVHNTVAAATTGIGPR